MVNGYRAKVKDCRGALEKCFLEAFGYQMPYVSDDDFALYTIDDDSGDISGFIIVHPFVDTAYCSWGAVPDRFKGTAIHLYSAAFQVLAEMGFSKASTIISANNKKMLMVALRVGYEIVGVGIGKHNTLEVTFSKTLGGIK